jgi:hypothetical protein
MFGLGGAARGYPQNPVYLAASLFNGLSDSGNFLEATLGSRDGRGAYPGWWIGTMNAYNSKTTMCQILELWQFFPYNDNSEQIQNCAACVAVTTRNQTIPGSLDRISGIGGKGNNATISELQLKVENMLEKILPFDK